MDDGNSLACQALRISDKEFEILIPALALISCANSRAIELGGGFSWVENGWKLTWPDDVGQGFGLRPSKIQKCKGENEMFKVLFEPFVTIRRSYWSTLFDLTAPALVISYAASSHEPPIIFPTDEEWLHWPWFVSKDEKIATMEKAIAAHNNLADQVDWLMLAEQSATTGSKHALFDAVVRHLAA